MKDPQWTGTEVSIVRLNIPDRATLNRSYMPFVKNGGLFIPTDRPFKLGDPIFILLTLLANPERIPVPARVIWVTPPNERSGRTQGVGVQFIASDSLSSGAQV